MTKSLEGIKTIYFDFDGTLHNTIKVYGDALRKGYNYLVELGYKEERFIPDEEAEKWLGWNATEMWQNFASEVPVEIRKKASTIVGKEMDRLVEIGVGELYPGAREVLEELNSRGYTLIYLSNCAERYKNAVTKAYDIGHYFKKQICSETFGHIPKEEIVKKVRHEYPEEQIVIGDRFHDMMAAKHNGLKSIFCLYGFGEKSEGAEADFQIESVREILELLP